MSSFICCIQSTCDGFHCINQTGSLLPLHRLPKNRWCFPFFKKSSYSKQQKPIFSCCPPDFPPKISPESRSPGVKLHLEEPAKESKRCGCERNPGAGPMRVRPLGDDLTFIFIFCEDKKTCEPNEECFWGLIL